MYIYIYITRHTRNREEERITLLYYNTTAINDMNAVLCVCRRTCLYTHVPVHTRAEVTCLYAHAVVLCVLIHVFI